MKILYIHQYFSSPKITVGARSYWISQELIKSGHQVTMLTIGENKVSRTRFENVDGINVIYLKGEYKQSMSIYERARSFFNFMLKATLVALKEPNVDLLIATSTPLTVGFPALVVKKLKKIPFIFEVRDLWPEVPIQMGFLKNKHLIKMAFWFEKTIYNNASHIIALSPGMLEGVASKKIPLNKISIIPNMSKIDVFRLRKKNNLMIKKLGLKNNSFKIVYFGAMGLANGMDYILDAIKKLKEMEDIEFVFLGSGTKRPLLKKTCKKEDISNVHFLGYFASKELSDIVNLCDVSLVTFLNIPILATNSPQKLFDSLSAEKPVIVNSPGWTKDLIEEYNCGVFVDPENSNDLVNKILFLKDNPKIRREMGRNGRKLAETKLDKSILSKEFVRVLEATSPKMESH